MKEKTFDIISTFEDTKQALELSNVKNAGKIELLNELIEFFNNNKLKVVQEVEEENNN